MDRAALLTGGSSGIGRAMARMLDVLVDSAGIGIAGRVEDLPAKHLDLQVVFERAGSTIGDVPLSGA